MEHFSKYIIYFHSVKVLKAVAIISTDNFDFHVDSGRREGKQACLV